MIEIYIGSERLDTFKDEDVNITLSIQNIKDISRLFTDFTQNFQVPASRQNNDVFKHYYNADISGGFNAALRQDATIFMNKELFREGSIELMSVDMVNGQPSAYEIVFFSAGVNLKDLFGEDQLTDLDLSAYDHAYTGSVIRGAMEGTTPLHSGNVIYPLISPVDDWFYDSASSAHNDNDIAYHTTNDDHGLHYYALKPAIRISKLIDAIESKYGITFTSTFFANSKFTDLFLWGHRREGYMFFDQANGYTAEKIDFTSATGLFDVATDTYTNGPLTTDLIWRYSITSANDYQLHWYVNGQYVMSRQHSGNVTNEEVYLNAWLSGGDKVQIRFSPPIDWGGETITINSCSSDGRPSASGAVLFTASTTTSQSFNTDVIMSDQMPEQKVYDFINGLIKMFNLVIEPTSRTKFNVEPLDDWYALGSSYDITDHVDISSEKIERPELHRRISFKYQEAGSYIEESYRNANGGVGYGDLRADFTFDGSELTAESTFELMKYQKLNDLSGGVTGFLVGKSIDKDGDPYIGQPVIFYSPATLSISSKRIGFLDESGRTTTPTNQVYLCGNINNRVAADVTQMLTYGLEVDPFHEQSFVQTLYNQFWEDYITDIYSTSRRVYQMKAILPFKVSSQLRMNDKLDIGGRRYVINEIQINLRTDEATLELLNDV
jgi:hypothetical protein